MRFAKIAAYVVGGLVGLIVLALVLIVVFVDPNDFRDDIERVVEAQTHRRLTLAGELELSLFPWLALKTGPASLADAPGFGDEPFVSIEDARVSVRVLPLLRGKIEAGAISLKSPRIRLITDENGRQNWADLGGGGEATPEPSEPGRPIELPTVAGLKIQDGAITIENRQEGSRSTVREFNLSTGRIASGEPFDFETDFIFDQDESLSLQVGVKSEITADLKANIFRLNDPSIDLKLSGAEYPQDGIPVQIRAASIESDLGRQTHRLDGFAMTTTWQGEDLPKAGIPIAMKAQTLALDLAQQTLDAQDMYAEVAGAQINAILTGQKILDAPRLQGRLALAPLALRDWLPRLGVEVPQTRDPNVLEKLSFASDVVITETSADLQRITLELDDTTATGSLGVADFGAKALRFDLDVNRIDADRYLPPPVEGESAAAAETDDAPTPIPVEALRALNARGELRIGEAIFAGIRFTKLRLGVNGGGGKMRFHPIEASMYGGTYRGDIGIDATGDAARISLNEQVSNIDFAPLFKDFFETDRVSGKGNASVKLTGVGRTTDDVMRTLDGNVAFNVTDGALEGADLWYEIRRARAVLKQEPVPERTGPARTAFSSLQGTGTMNKGVLTNNDLNVAMQYLKVTGQGTVDIPNSTLDYRLIATVLKIPREGADTAQEQDLVDAQIPVRITGALSDPKVRPDVEGYLKEQVKQKIDEEKRQLEEKVKEKIGDKLKDFLRR